MKNIKQLEKEPIITSKPIGLLGSGSAFSWHEKLAEKLECSTDFAKPYYSCLNENHNGLLRQFFPKQMGFG